MRNIKPTPTTSPSSLSLYTGETHISGETMSPMKLMSPVKPIPPVKPKTSSSHTRSLYNTLMEFCNFSLTFSIYLFLSFSHSLNPFV